MRPETREEFEIRDIDRADIEKKTGKSIMQLIKEGVDVDERLLKEVEEELALEMKLKKERRKTI
mgnify:CR=1 FL=1